MSNKNQKHSPKHFKGTPCKKCGSTLKLQVKRKNSNTNEIYYTSRCIPCNKYKRNAPTIEWQRKNREHLRAYQREYYKPKYKERNGTNARRLRERQVYNNKKEIAEFYRNCPEGYHVDHIIPLNGKNVSGLHTIGNLQYLRATENLSKSNKF